MPSGRDLSASGSGDCERGTDQDDTYLTLTTVEAAVTQRRYATAQRTPRMGPAVWAEVGEGMAASTAAEVMPSARTQMSSGGQQNKSVRVGPQRPPDVISGQSVTRCSATRIAFATIVRVGFTLPLVGCKEESQTTTRLLPQSRP